MESRNLNFQAIKNNLETNTLGELRLRVGDQVELIDERSVFLKIKTSGGNIGFAPLSCLNGINFKGDDDKNIKIIAMVHQHHEPENPDEVNINIGDLVLVKGVMDDGWCFGKSNGKNGWIPCNHLVPLAQNFQRVVSSRETLRNSRSYEAEFKALGMTGDSSEKDLVGKIIKPWEGYEWYYGKLPMGECEKLLLEYGEIGDYLIRLRNDCISLSLMVLSTEGVKTFIIQIINTNFVIGDQSNTSLRKLLEFYTNKTIGYCINNDPIVLKKTIKKVP